MDDWDLPTVAGTAAAEEGASPAEIRNAAILLWGMPRAENEQPRASRSPPVTCRKASLGSVS